MNFLNDTQRLAAALVHLCAVEDALKPLTKVEWFTFASTLLADPFGAELYNSAMELRFRVERELERRALEAANAKKGQPQC